MMSLDDLKRDLSERLGQSVIALFTRDGAPVTSMSDLYQASPAGFGGRLMVLGDRYLTWELWLEDDTSWNFHYAPAKPTLDG